MLEARRFVRTSGPGEHRPALYHDSTIASASISTSMSGSMRRLTSTIDVVGRIVTEDLAVGATNRLPVADDVGHVHARPDDLLQ